MNKKKEVNPTKPESQGQKLARGFNRKISLPFSLDNGTKGELEFAFDRQALSLGRLLVGRIMQGVEKKPELAASDFLQGALGQGSGAMFGQIVNDPDNPGAALDIFLSLAETFSETGLTLGKPKAQT
ncbi:MAG: hypothetical protein A2527_14130 [Candidatus Lambdaproteobacteria bacterium RIFOXYD2_FULL_50_16]|uniref:Uncharacterized protein n=1 Tax=Candidatus Lambdaproteobacteria bacterium RIFOXYD2_FULL_50_16 TaxID=1817772 RepID=A0A1F6G4R1_9PROT|nr:MAG: hypothetical protein A2527_14130 [Candidatus Lambdaproteobacteria bacterium RIFOXYD2_FULL_50_16]